MQSQLYSPLMNQQCYAMTCMAAGIGPMEFMPENMMKMRALPPQKWQMRKSIKKMVTQLMISPNLRVGLNMKTGLKAQKIAMKEQKKYLYQGQSQDSFASQGRGRSGSIYNRLKLVWWSPWYLPKDMAVGSPMGMLQTIAMNLLKNMLPPPVE